MLMAWTGKKTPNQMQSLLACHRLVMQLQPINLVSFRKVLPGAVITVVALQRESASDG